MHIVAANEEIKRRAVPKRHTDAGRPSSANIKGFYDENAPDSTEPPEGMIAPENLGMSSARPATVSLRWAAYTASELLWRSENHTQRPVLASSTDDTSNSVYI